MIVHIVYATCEGQTGKIARFVEAVLRDAHHKVETFDADDVSVPVPFVQADAVILAAPVHERRHPKSFEVLLAAQRATLNRRPTLMLSVSLSAAFPAGLEDAQDYLTEMEMRTGVTATMSACVAGAVRTAQYDYFAAQLIRHVVLRDRDYDPSRGEHEFTDWTALRHTLSEFLAPITAMA